MALVLKDFLKKGVPFDPYRKLELVRELRKWAQSIAASVPPHTLKNYLHVLEQLKKGPVLSSSFDSGDGLPSALVAPLIGWGLCVPILLFQDSEDPEAVSLALTPLGLRFLNEK